MRHKNHRYLLYFFALSLLLHLLFVYLARLPAPMPQTRLFYQPRTTFFDPIQPFHSTKPYQPPTKMERLPAPLPTLSPEQAALLDIPLAALAPVLPPLPDLPDTILVPQKGEFRARVWLEAWEHVEKRRDRRIIHNVGTYLYPIATWQYRGFDFYTNKSIRVQPSFDPNKPNPAYLIRNPAISRDRFYRLFEHRWLFFDARRRELRQQGEVARWHFIDRFLGHGIVLDYIGTEPFDRQITQVVRVDDRRYGHYFEAFFSQKTGLLVATREGLVSAEQRRYTRRYQMQPPIWSTTYTKYRPVQGVLFPHRLTRSGPSCPHCLGQSRRNSRTVEVTIQLQMAFNGEDPVLEAPDLEY